MNQALWQALRSDPGSGVNTSGTATVLGWTRELDLGIRLNDRRQTPAGRTALVAGTGVAAPPGRVPAVAVHRDVVRGGFNDLFGEQAFVRDGGATVLRFTLPPGADPTLALELRSSLPLDSVEFWVGDTWGAVPGGSAPAAAPTSQPAPPPPLSVPPGGSSPFPVPFPMPFQERAGLGFSEGVAVPRAAASSGVLFARITGIHSGGDQHTWVTVGEAR